LSGRSWDIIGRRKWGYALSLLIILPGVIALILNATSGRGALDWGIDFTGGNFFQVRIDRAFTVADVRPVVDRVATGQSVIQKSGQEVFIRTRPLAAGKSKELVQGLQQEFGTVTVLREDEVGPRIGRELRNIAIVAVVLGLLLQVIYISVRFKSIRFAVAADVALLHDLLVVIGIFALTRKEVNSSFVAVLLTVVGYSINDTIVLFDRIRENLAQRTREAFDRLVNRSILEALVRSINTALTTILAIGALYFFGGSTIHDFAFGLMIGIFTGAYSSILNASPILVDWHLWSERREQGGREAPKAVEPAREPAAVSGPRPAVSRPGGARPGRRRNRR
jgi:preprotein translocase subunit SecF